MGLHSSSSLLNLSRFVTESSKAPQHLGQKTLTLSLKVHECKSLTHGASAVRPAARRGAGRGLHLSTFQLNLSRLWHKRHP